MLLWCVVALAITIVAGIAVGVVVVVVIFASAALTVLSTLDAFHFIHTNTHSTHSLTRLENRSICLFISYYMLFGGYLEEK